MKSRTGRTACRRFAALAGFGLALVASGQQAPKSLSPVEAYKFALAPYNATRNQANDLTEADRVALGIGVERAAENCRALSTDLEKAAREPKELFALIELCNFGRQYEPARAAAVRYLGLGEPGMAEPQVRTMMLDHPYDATIHATLREVMGGLEGANPDFDALAMELCQAEREATLPLLAEGKGLADTENSFSSVALFRDAAECAALGRGLHKPDELEKLAAIARQANWRGTADQRPIEEALGRQQMVGPPVPVEALRGVSPGVGAAAARTVSLRRGTVLLMPFTLWSPAALDVAAELRRQMPRQTIYAITSWRANTGGEDKPSREVLEKLRQWQREMGRAATVLIVPDAVLESFYGDVFPAGILIREGVVQANLPLTSRGAQRLLLRAGNEKP